MKTLFLARIFIVLIFPVAAIAQTAPPDTLWTRTFGEASGGDYGEEVHVTSEGGFLIGGTTYSYGEGRADMWLIKTDANGDLVWHRPFGGADWDMGCSAIVTGDDHYIIAGMSTNPEDAWVIKTNANGHIIWSRYFGGPWGDEAIRIIEAQDGNYVFCGLIIEDAGNSFYLVKVGTNGDEIWSRIYGGTDHDYARAVQPTADGNLIVTGPVQSYGAGESDVWLIKTDAEGDSLWSRTYGAVNSEWSNSILQTDDGGYVVAGVNLSAVPGDWLTWVFKTDAMGNMEWQRILGDGIAEWYEINCIQPAPGGGYILAGSIYTGSDYDMLITRLAANGEELWTKIIGEPNTGQFAKWIEPLAGGGYIIVGNTAHQPGGLEDLYLVRLGPEDMTAVADTSPGAMAIHGNHPNPFNPHTVITWSLPADRHVELTVHDVSGALVRTLHSGVRDAGRHQSTWFGRNDAGNDMPSGLYLYRLAGGDETVAGKMLLIR